MPILSLLLGLPGPAALPPPADISAHAAEAEAPSGPTIIVTARRRAEDAQTIPQALTVVDRNLLDRSYTVNTQQLSTLVPTLNYSSANPRNTAFTIRGLGSSVVSVSQANDGLEPGVGYYVDQVYHARPATAAFDFNDLDQIEVLRGPQGTVFGKNSTAGAINIATAPPSFRPELRAEVSVGGFGFVQAKAVVSGPVLGDTVAFRLSGQSTRRGGVIDNVALGRPQNDLGNNTVRGQLLFAPSARFHARLIADFADFRSECCTQVYVRVAPTLRPAARQYAGLVAGLPAPYAGYAPPSLNPYDRKTSIDAPLGVDTNEGGVSAIADHRLGGATLTSVSAWRFWNWDAANDRDYTSLPIQRIQHIPSRQDQYSQELRLASKRDGRVNYVGGLYFFRQRIIGRPISVYGPLAAYWLLGPTTGAGATPVPGALLDGYGTDGRTDFRSDSYAAFAEVNWRPVDRLTLTGGLRYTYEEKAGSYRTTVSGGLVPSDAALLRAQRSIFSCQTAIFRSDVCQSYAAATRDGSLTGRANIAYQLNASLFGYASVARGAKSGGINVSGLPLGPDGLPALAAAVVLPEQNTAYEAGLKAQLFGNRLTLNIDGYYTDVTDFQANVTDARAAAALRTYLANIPRVVVKGVELDASAAPTPDFSLRAALAYADGRYASYANGPCPIERIGNSTAVCDLSGRPLPGLPKWSATLGGDYARPVTIMGTRGSLYVHADSASRTAVFGDPTDSAYTVISGYTIVNASLGFRASAGWEIAVFARNLFNSDYLQNLTVQAGNSGLIVGTPGDPRIVGLTLRVQR